MPDLKRRILDIIRRPQLSACATITIEGNPWVRYVVAVSDENLIIRFASLLESRKVQQIQNNPEVHLTCGVSSLEEDTPYLQIQGLAKVSTDEQEKQSFWDDKLKSVFDGPDDPKYCVVVIEPYRIEYCTQGPFEPDVWSRSID